MAAISTRVRAAAAIALASVGMAIAQQRQPCFATVLGRDGEPVVGATVTCVFTPDGLNPWPRDVVTATSDGRGRAKCDLLPGQIYSVWAIAMADGQGDALVSNSVALVAAGRVLDLPVLDRRARRVLSLPGIEPWRALGAAGLRWLPDARCDVWNDLPLPAGSTVELPPSPVVLGTLALLDARGEVMVTVGVDPFATELPALPPPMAIDVRVKDDSGQPVAGATVRHPVKRYAPWRTVFRSGYDLMDFLPVAGTTDSAGCLRVHAPTPARIELLGRSKPGTQLVFASASGRECAGSAIGVAGTLDFVLRPAIATTLRLANVREGAPEFAAIGRFRVAVPSGVTVVDKRLESRKEDGALWTVFSGSAGFRPALRLSAARPMLVVTGRIDGPGGEHGIDLGAGTPIRVRVVDAGGGPMPCALGVQQARDGYPMVWDAVGATNAAGVADLHLPPGDFFVYATNGTSHALAAIDRTSPEPLALRLTPLPTMQLRVSDAEGRPVAGARAQGEGAESVESGGELLEQMWSRICDQAWWDYVLAARSDSLGVMYVPAFVRQGLKQRLLVRASSGTASVTLRAGGTEDVIVRQ